MGVVVFAVPQARSTTIQKFVLAEKGRQVLFDFNKAVLKPAAISQLAPVLQALKEQPSLQVLVVGHTDSVGSDAYNMGLSQRRAQAVADLPGKERWPRQSIKTRVARQTSAHSLECERRGPGAKPSCGNHLVARELNSHLMERTSCRVARTLTRQGFFPTYVLHTCPALVLHYSWYYWCFSC